MNHGLTNNIAYIVPDAETVCECLAGERTQDMEAMQPIWHKAAVEYVASLDGTLAATSTLDYLDQAAQIERKPDFFYQLPQRINAHLRNWNRHAKIWLRNAIGKPKKVKPYSKWKPLTLEEFKKHVARFAFYDPRFAELEITSAYLDCFRLRMPNNTNTKD